MSDSLRETIDSCGFTRYRIAKETGVTQASLSRFMTGKTTLSLDAVDVLAGFLGLELTASGGANKAIGNPAGKRSPQQRGIVRKGR